MGRIRNTEHDDEIKIALLKGDNDCHGIARIYGVSYNNVYLVLDEIKQKEKYFKDEDEISTVILGHKDEPYQTEEEMISSPYYGATNKQLLTSIRKDWKLF